MTNEGHCPLMLPTHWGQQNLLDKAVLLSEKQNGIDDVATKDHANLPKNSTARTRVGGKGDDPVLPPWVNKPSQIGRVSPSRVDHKGVVILGRVLVVLEEQPQV